MSSITSGGSISRISSAIRFTALIRFSKEVVDVEPVGLGPRLARLSQHLFGLRQHQMRIRLELRVLQPLGAQPLWHVVKRLGADRLRGFPERLFLFRIDHRFEQPVDRRGQPLAQLPHRRTVFIVD